MNVLEKYCYDFEHTFTILNGKIVNDMVTRQRSVNLCKNYSLSISLVFGIDIPILSLTEPDISAVNNFRILSFYAVSYTAYVKICKILNRPTIKIID
jgi:hypothetical protein